MKKKYLPKTTIVLSLVVCFIILSQCKWFRQKEESPYKDVQVNTAFATNPPIATSVNITEISPAVDSGNLLFEATMPKEKIKSDVLAIMLGDSTKVVLHDDGKNGDKVAGDGVYSTVMNVNTDSLKLYIAERASDAKRLLRENKQQLFQFSGRMEFPISRNTLASLTSLANVNKEEINFKQKFAFLNPSISIYYSPYQKRLNILPSQLLILQLSMTLQGRLIHVPIQVLLAAHGLLVS